MFLAHDSSPLLSLPPELLSGVVSHLPAETLSLCLLVSRRLFVFASSALWADPFPLLRCASATDGLVVPFLLAKHGAKIRRLRFPEASPRDALEFTAMHQLQRLDLAALDQFAVTDEHIKTVVFNCPFLVDLQIPDCVGCTDKALQHMLNLKSIAFFDSLNIDRCCEMSDTGLIPLIQKMPNLLHLSCNLIPLATESLVFTIASTCSKLETLNMADCDALTNDSLFEIASGCPNLHSIDFSECMQLSEEGLIEFVRARKSGPLARGFKSLKLNGLSTAVTDRSLTCLATGQVLEPLYTSPPATRAKSALHHLELSHLQNLTSTTFATLTSTILPNTLTTLTLSHISIDPITSSPTLSHFLSTQHALTTLTITNNLLTDPLATSIATHCQLLTTLDVSESPLLTDTGAAALTSQCRRLTSVNFKGCTGITDTTIHSFFLHPETQLPHPHPSNLRFLNIGLCNRLTDACGTHLARLALGGCTRFSDRGMHTIKFSGCFNVSDATLDRITASIRDTSPASQESPSGSLRLLCFSGCFKLSTTSLQQSFQRSFNFMNQKNGATRVASVLSSSPSSSSSPAPSMPRHSAAFESQVNTRMSTWERAAATPEFQSDAHHVRNQHAQ
ncbi:hypothetical protein HDU98_011405 [Podochytrium sp. JEL0797]|nr:hypothetical protein HDU98_011405 [Podochytrium sp. JEL0797]